MKIKKTWNLFYIIMIAGSFSAYGQTNPIQSFERLIGSPWVSEGKEEGGLQSKAVYEFAWGLDGKIVKTKYSNTDPNTFEFGLRNEGIRIYNTADSVIQFYEFDKLGGVTSGTVLVEEKNLHYEYKYYGLALRDSWEFIDENNYKLTVGIWKNGTWEKKYLETTLKKMN